MLGALILAVVIVFVIPALVLMSGAVMSILLGTFLKDDGEARHAGSELVDLYR